MNRWLVLVAVLLTLAILIPPRFVNPPVAPKYGLVLGAHWVMRNTSSGSLTTFDVEPVTAMAGYTNGPSNQLLSITIRKTDPATYWNPGHGLGAGEAGNVHYVLNVYPVSPGKFQYVHAIGDWRSSINDITILETWNYARDKDVELPPDILLPATPNMTGYQTQWQACHLAGQQTDALRDRLPSVCDQTTYPRAWASQFANKKVSTPAYKGTAMCATYQEGVISHSKVSTWWFEEEWCWAKSVDYSTGNGGLVRLTVLTSDSQHLSPPQVLVRVD